MPSCWCRQSWGRPTTGNRWTRDGTPSSYQPGITDGINQAARGQELSAGNALIVPFLDTITSWATAQQAAKALGLSATRLRQLQAEGKLEAGEHWVYLTGTEGGPVGWDIQAISDWQRKQTAVIAKQRRNKAAPIETYQEEGQVNG